MRRIALCLFVLALCAPLPRALAQDTPEYLVEVIVFRHTDAFDAGELWTPPVPVFSPPPVAEQDSPAQSPPPRRIGRFERLAAEEYALGEVAQKIAASSRLSILAHTGWRQRALPIEEAEAKSVSGRDNVARVNGSVLLFRSRFLRLDFDLTLQHDGGSYPLRQERRRVQTGVPHYIDHPHFGIIALVSRAQDRN